MDWMGRALSQIIIRDLAGARGVYAIPFDQLHSRDVAFGVRPVQAPGISAERTLALAAGANRLGYGEYAVGAGKIEARLTIEDPQTQKVVRVLLASGPASDPFEPADALARQIASGAAPYPTRSPAALQEYIKGLESANTQDRTLHFEEAISADPDFGPPQFLLAQSKAQQDRPGALSVLNQALARRLPDLERARLSYLAATLHGDFDAGRDALARWSHAAPNDPEVWSSLAADSMARHQYKQAMQANQKALAVQPDDANILNQLGYTAALSGQLDTAMDALRRYQALRPGDANPLDSMGDVNLVLGRLREAENFYIQAAKRDPSFLNGGDFFKAAMARLMSGDVAGADPLAKQFADRRAAAKDPMADFHRAAWSWISGRRTTGFQQMQTLAAAAEKSAVGGQNTAARTIASQAYSQLAIWSLALGDRARGSEWAAKAAALTIPATADFARVARFLTQPSASESEWILRAERTFSNAAQTQERDTVLAYALLADKNFTAAAKVLEPLYRRSSVISEEALPVLLAWAYIESGNPQQAAGLLSLNPVPSQDGVKPLSVFDFPRLFYLRGRIAVLAGNPEQAQSYYRLFAQLSGDEPLTWGEEATAKQ
jgi:tetratricopeptide (TPR) repeat protein